MQRSFQLSFVLTLIFAVGGAAFAVGPLTYPARTDTCETSNTGACAGLGMKFLGRPGDPLPAGLQLGLTRSSAFGTDADFHSKIYRVTDSTDNNFGTLTMNIGGHHWSIADSKSNRMFIVNTVGGSFLLRYFNNGVTTKSQIRSSLTGAGDATHFGHYATLAFSWTKPNTIFEFYGRNAGQAVAQINVLTIDPVSDTITSRVLLFDFANDPTGKCLPSGYMTTWVGVFDSSQDDQAFTLTLSNTGGQQSGYDVVNYTQTKGCRYLRTDTFQVINSDWGSPAGPIVTDQPFQDSTGTFHSCSVSAPCTLHDGFTLHDGAQRHNSAFAAFSGDVCNAGHVCSCPGTPGVCQKYYWQVGTNVVRPCNNITDCEGHASSGYTGEFIGGHGLSHFYSQPNTGVLNANGVNPGNPDVKTIITTPPVDNHGTYDNGDSGDKPPFFFSTEGVPSDPNPVGYLSAYYDEIIGTKTDGSGTTYRFAHTFDTGDSPTYEGQSASAEVSPDGNWLLVTSDMMGKLGDTDPNVNGACKSDLRANSVWIKSSATSLGYQVFSLSNDDIFKATTAGTTGTTQPNWVANCGTVGSTCTDGTVVWTNLGQNSCRADVFAIDLNSAH